MRPPRHQRPGAELPAWSLWGFASASLAYVLIVALLHASGLVPVAASAVAVVVALSPLLFFALLFVIAGLEAGDLGEIGEPSETGWRLGALFRDLDADALLQPRLGAFALYAALVTGALASLVGAAPDVLAGDRARLALTLAVYVAALLMGIALSLAGRWAPVRG